LLAASLAAFVVSLVIHYAAVVPLEKSLLSSEVRGLAADIDSAVRVRNLLMSAAAGNAEAEAFLEAGGLEKLLNGLRKHFQDFLSIEIANERGQIQAMGGELALPRTSLLSKDASSKTSAFDLDIQHNRGIFQDDPDNDCFLITCKHVGSGGGKWFTRARFSRQSLASILKSVPSRRVALLPISGVSKEIPDIPASLPRPELSIVRTFESWWLGPTGAEALLPTPGWLIRMEKISARPLLLRPLIATSLFLFMFAMLISFALRQASKRFNSDQDAAAETTAGNRLPVQSEKAGEESKSGNRPDSFTEDSRSMFRTMAKDCDDLSPTPECRKTDSPGHPLPVNRTYSLCMPRLPGRPNGSHLTEATALCRDDSEAENFRKEIDTLPELLEVCWSESGEHCGMGEPWSPETDKTTHLSCEHEELDNEHSSSDDRQISASS
jgi:hypothetical protein